MINKKNYLLIIWSITITIMCISTVHFGNKAWKVIKNGLKIHFNDNEEISWDYDKSDKFSFNQDLDEFTTLDVDGSVMRLNIKQGDTYRISAEYNRNYLKPEVNVKNGKLSVSQPASKNFYRGSTRCEVTIYIPGGKKLDDAAISIDVGEINLKDFNCEKLSASTDVGELSISNVDFINLYAESDVGELSIKTVNPLQEYNLDLSTDIGEIRIDGEQKRHNFNQTGTSGKKIIAKTNIGELRIK